MNFLIYAGCTALGLLISFMGFVFAMTGGTESAYVIGGMLLLTYAAVIYFVVKKAKEGKGPQTAYLLILPMFIVSATHAAFFIGRNSITYILPNSDEFDTACKTAGANFQKIPTLPVQSVAFYHETKYKPHYTSYSVSWGNRISSLSYKSAPIHPSFKFVESGPNDIGKRYSRKPKDEKEYGIDEITADVIVKFNMSPEEELRKALGSQGLVNYELTVIDRRTNEQLASLHYVTDTKRGRACGLTGENVMSEREFILKAVGLQ